MLWYLLNSNNCCDTWFILLTSGNITGMNTSLLNQIIPLCSLSFRISHADPFKLALAHHNKKYKQHSNKIVFKFEFTSRLDWSGSRANLFAPELNIHTYIPLCVCTYSRHTHRYMGKGQGRVGCGVQWCSAFYNGMRSLRYLQSNPCRKLVPYGHRPPHYTVLAVVATPHIHVQVALHTADIHTYMYMKNTFISTLFSILYLCMQIP